MTKRCQFSLRSLLAAAGVLGLVAWSATVILKQEGFQRRVAEFEAARVRYYEKWIGYQAGMALPGDVCEASAELTQAERAVSPSVESQRNAIFAHIERLKLLRENVSAPPDLATTVDKTKLDLIECSLHDADEALHQLDQNTEGRRVN